MRVHLHEDFLVQRWVCARLFNSLLPVLSTGFTFLFVHESILFVLKCWNCIVKKKKKERNPALLLGPYERRGAATIQIFKSPITDVQSCWFPAITMHLLSSCLLQASPTLIADESYQSFPHTHTEATSQVSATGPTVLLRKTRGTLSHPHKQ